MTGKLIFPKWQDKNGEPLSLYKFSSVYISKTFKQLTQHAEITIPRNVKFFDKQQIRDIFRRGDEVVIELGYNGNLKEEFRGYITSIGSDIPIVINVEDEMWKIKRIPVNYVGKNVNLSKMIATMLQNTGYESQVAPYEMGDLRFPKKTMYDVLNWLETEHNIHSYYANGKLFVGEYYSNEVNQKISHFNLERNVVSNALNYKKSEDVLIKIDATSITADGKKIEFSIGDHDGSILRLKYYNITAKAELEKKVKSDYENAKRGGLEGSFTAFGIPSVAFGQKATIESIIYPDRNGEYFIEGVEKTFDTSGYRQVIKLGGSAKLTGNG